MAKELEKMDAETQVFYMLFSSRQYNKDLVNLMKCLKEQDKDNKAILYESRYIKKVILPVEEYHKMYQCLEVLNILKDSPFILQKIFKNKGLKNQEEFDKRYFWGTITEDKRRIVKEWLENE